MFGQKVLKKGHVRQSWRSANPVAVVVVALVVFVGFLALSPHLDLARSSSTHCVKVEDTLRSEFRGRLGLMMNRRGDSIQEKQLQLDENGGSGEAKRSKLVGVVGIQTGFDSEERRKSLRETWMPSTTEGIARLEESTGLAFRFVIGYTKDVWKTAALEREINQYRDFIRIDIEEDYHRLKYKTLAYFKAAFLLFDADFYVKADDDIYLRPDRLSTLLAAERPTSRTYLGCMKKGPVITNSRMKWYEPMGYMLGSDYFLHAYGPIYALSREVVADLYAARNDSFRYFSNEDVTVGVWMLAMNVNHEDNRALCDPACHDNSIAVWDIPKCSGLCNSPEKMRELHKLDICSKSPTTPN